MDRCGLISVAEAIQSSSILWLLLVNKSLLEQDGWEPSYLRNGIADASL